MSEAIIRVTIEDLATGEKEMQEVGNDYLLITAGTCYTHYTQVFPSTGTHIVTIKGRGGS